MESTAGARPGYELWRPNRENAEAKTTKALVSLVLLVSAGLLAIITLGGWERLQSPGVGAATLLWAGLYVVFALLALNWMRGILPVASALAMIMAIFAAVAAPGWFARDKAGLDSPILPEELLGLLTIVVIPVQLILIAIAMIGFNQDWHVEEERPIGGGPHDDEYAGDYEEPAEMESLEEVEEDWGQPEGAEPAAESEPEPEPEYPDRGDDDWTPPDTSPGQRA